jgi:hypothetical protein
MKAVRGKWVAIPSGALPVLGEGAMGRVVLTAVLLVGVSRACRSATLEVPTSFATIQEALDTASPGDTVVVAPGEYVITEPIDFKGKEITLRSSSGPATTTLRMSDAPTDANRASVVVFDHGETEGTLLEGFRITGGKGTKRADGGGFSFGGGILCAEEVRPTISRCIIVGNATSGSGGGFHGIFSSAKLINCLITGNTAYAGGAALCDESDDSFINCTIVGNTATSYDGAVSHSGDDGDTTLLNCIVWNNSPPFQPDDDLRLSHTILDRDPLFLNVPGGDFRLSPDSPAIDAGSEIQAPTIDLEGKARLCGGGVDLGAYELGQCQRPGSFGLFIQADPAEGGSTTPAPGLHGYPAGTPVHVIAKALPGFHTISWRSDSIFLPIQFPGDAIDVTISGTVLVSDLKVTFSPNAFVRGDANADFAFDISDPIRILAHLFGGEVLPCLSAADANDDGSVDISDPVTILGSLFAGGGPLSQPFGSCNLDPTEDSLVCESYPPCG